VQELGESTARQTAKLASGNVPHRKCPAQFMNGGSLGGRRLSVFVLFLGVQFSLVQEFELFQEFH